ncbi:cryptochrome/photolyase family protein [Pseudarthrobacter sp. C4D7]|uniref:cryptochrome/photolyase family protein n=1 Tax=Pseudarthrobacter sp. C4D7 TaxID=2735268 RepID=UPI0015850479|nr:cryptochrome/photolyase family protein [Pseudarthrobacter sp. C4D7]NUT69909.1 cryptochrome/photolyase family protein [Pseudarthrobacter sp. C4D7]
MTAGQPLRLVLPHQLFEQQWEGADQGTVYVLIEHDLYFRQYSFHAHKLVLHRASMAGFARRLRGLGHDVVVLPSDRTRASRVQLADLVRQRRPRKVTWFDVVDDWLERDLTAGLADAGYAMQGGDVLESPNFLTSRAQIQDWFANNPARMHDFYVWQRRRLDVLMDGGGPVGGKWSFDADNRKKLPRGYAPPTVSRFRGHHALRQDGMFQLDGLGEASGPNGRETSEDAARDVESAISWVAAEFPDAPGDPHLFAWPTTPEEARQHLQEFVDERLDGFGPYEDAISAAHPFINHGLLTPALNIGLLNPAEVVHAVLDSADEGTPLASLEGFVRQVIGWREYMRATYLLRGRRMRTANLLNHRNQLGAGWWDATTGLAPVDLVVSRVLTTGYAHHIERLMVLGNAMSLLRIHPDDVYEWFMEMFIDAYDWVMVPNVYAMSQFAAGADITTKPYVSGSNYLRKMSDLPAGEWTADWDGLYWTYVEDHRPVFERNPRSRMIASLVDRMDPGVRDGHRRRARDLLSRPGAHRLAQAPPCDPEGDPDSAAGQRHQVS